MAGEVTAAELAEARELCERATLDEVARLTRERDEALGRTEFAERNAEVERILRDDAANDLIASRAQCVEVSRLARELAVIGLDLVNGRAPSISTSEMIRSRMDRLSAISSTLGGEAGK